MNVRGNTFTVNHALNCAKGAFPTLRHNEIRNYIGKLLAEVCTDVTLEPNLQPLEGESLQFATSNREDNARADIRARGFWGSHRQCAFFNVKVFNPTAQSYRRSSLEANYTDERKKQRSECMKKESSRWNMVHLPHSSLQQPVEWASLPPHSTRGWHQ